LLYFLQILQTTL